MRAATALVLLAACAGGMDLLSIVVLGGVFSSVITGNLVHAGHGLGAGHLLGAATATAAVTAFGAGVWVWARLLGPPTALSHRRRTALLAAHTTLLALFALAWGLLGGDPPTHGATLALLAPAAFSMGAQSAWTHTAGASTTYLTGTLTSALAGWALGDRLSAHGGALARLAALVTGALATVLLWEAVPWAAPLWPLACAWGALVLWWPSHRSGANTPA
ncbi:YoaK family protein [Nocardiopsis ganjiahuensis]|uniref:YoaK family protein n=1 Tax=Nocardiopsis ganjiahuensis TaxID=239984 RepID=UPI000349836B|nr:YoaK family protein [Nocardiopsis ganjiahuensis]